jgi:S-adenosylmethionine synthetase
MSKIVSKHLFTSESVSEGHPDKVADQISDAILDAYLAQDAKSRVACETLTKTNLVVVAGEITSKARIASADIEKIVRQVVREIGYTVPGIGFDADSVKIEIHLTEQSPDISQGVTEGVGDDKDQGAGDQGMMFGYASNETPELMPMPLAFAHRLVRQAAKLRHDGTLSYLRPDAKSQVTIEYDNGKPVRVDAVVLSNQSDDKVSIEQLRADIKRLVIDPIIPQSLIGKEGLKVFINPTGRFVLGGPQADTGLTGRKIIVDSYGGVGAHGGGAFSGKDPSKVDRSAAYFARYVAKNIVAAGLADKCEVQVAYAIGIAKPVSVNVACYGTSKISEEEVLKLVLENFDFRPKAITESLNLLRPIYKATAAYGHFGRDEFPWEQTNKVEALKKGASVAAAKR